MMKLITAIKGKIMLMYPDDRVLVAIMNNLDDWQRVQDEHWYRIPDLYFGGE